QAPVLRTRYRYVELPPLENTLDEGDLLTSSEVLLEVRGAVETEQHKSLFDYFDAPKEAFFHGRALRQSELRNSCTTTTEFSYRKVIGAQGTEVLQTLETLTGFDHGGPDRNGKARNVQKIVTSQHSLIHGQVLLSRDDNDVEIATTYDALQRVTSETVAPKTEFEATRFYTYLLTSLDGQQAMQLLTDVKGVQTRSFFDGLNRVIREDRQDVDTDPVRRPWRQIYAAQHDALENLIEETEFDWLETQTLPLVSAYEFDDWGQQFCVTGPDGIKAFEVTDPIGNRVVPIVCAWRQGPGNEPLRTGVEKTWLGKFEKPDRVERLDLSEQVISVHRYDYDGLGRTLRETDARDAVTEYGYDAYDRMTVTVLPDKAQVVRAYAEHSSADLPTKICVDDVVLGEQCFDGLDRMILSDTGGRIRHLLYEPGQAQPASIITASGQEILYEYVPQLGEEPKRRRLPGSDSNYIYDKQNARLLNCEESGLELTREYFSNGELKSETRRESSQQYQMSYVYSFRGRLLRYTDVLGQTQRYDYDLDKAGRLKSTRLGTTLSQFTYDDLGQIQVIETQDEVQGLQLRITLEYDAFGREVLRKFDSGGWHQELLQEYNAVDALEHRCLSEGTEILRDEHYEYDLRGRLTKYLCTGTQPPIDPYGKAIEQQTFRFDKLDNLTRVLTYFPGDRNDANYFFETRDPAQLSRVTNSHDDYPQEIPLHYDADGNITCDEWGRRLDYDALGRLVTVSGPSAELPADL
ncbi:RHS repeat domain-containing protein, partial [Pseudomonas sp. 3JA]|uniref:RHS repeat domain-containing protein n=1 Tax=Pseudomonas sp. 3JA TaxID=3109347 RepID=UPI003B5D38B2